MIFADLLKIIHAVSVRSSPCDLHACGFWEKLGRGPFRSHSVQSSGFREHRRVIDNSRPHWGYRVQQCVFCQDGVGSAWVRIRQVNLVSRLGQLRSK